MPVESSPSGAVIVTGPEIRTVALLTLASALAMKINSGMELTRISALQGAKNLGVIPKDKRGNAKQALRRTVELLREADPLWQPKANVAKALGWVEKDAYDVKAGESFIVTGRSFTALADASGEFRPYIETTDGPIVLMHGERVLVTK